MSDVDKYRDTSRYSNRAVTQNNIPLSSNNFSRTNENYQASRYSRNSGEKYSYKHVKKNNMARKRKNFYRTAIIVAIFLVIGVGAWRLWPIQVEVNGQELTLTYDKTVKQAASQAGVQVKPGNFVAVDYSIIKKGEGNEYYAEVNEQEVKHDFELKNGDKLTYTDGKDLMEDYDSDDSDVAATAKIVGTGAVHKFEGTGTPGTWSLLHGKISGKSAERMTKEPDNVTVRCVNIDPGKEKVIALTFDDGPSDDHTQDILDILKKYDAHATFCVVGERLEESWGKKLVAKEQQAGHQVITHTYDHARPAGGLDMTGLSAEKQIWEITEGKKIIEKATGTEVSSVVRVPGGNLSTITCRLIAPYVSAEIGWNIDTGDWEKPGSSVILKHMELASTGDIILCHDGGGDRSETVDALDQFLKDYTSKGYRFITIDELLEFDEAQQKNDTTASTSKYA